MRKIGAVRGFRDITPPESALWGELEARARNTLETYNFAEVRLPLVERTELFARSIGEHTDIVEKEMYTFDDRDGSSLTLRPEGTASVVRAYVDGGFAATEGSAKFFYLGPMFRRERPQKGRFRQFHQIGVELIGRDDPLSDAEVILLLEDLLDSLGAKDFTIEINSVGDSDCRPSYRQALKDYGEAKRGQLCRNCLSRLDRNPLRMLDCKNQSCLHALADAPVIRDHLCPGCHDHFDRVCGLLAAQGMSPVVNPRLVRGLDYYTRTAFEVVAQGLGAQNAVGGGGRYDDLVARFGGPAKPAIGFALGMERLVMIAGNAGERRHGSLTFLIPLVAEAEGAALSLARKLRLAGVSSELEASGASLKSRMRRAGKLGAGFVVIIGEDELRAGRGTVRDMKAKKDHPLSFPLDGSGPELAQQLGRLANG